MRLVATILSAAVLPALASGASETWGRGTGAPLPVARGEVAATLAGGLIYVVGGFTADGENSARVDAYSPKTNSWRAVPDLPLPVDHAMAAGARGRVYVAGGYGPDRARLATLFSFSGGAWERLTPMPEQRAAAGAAVVKGKLYVVGGVSSATIDGVKGGSNGLAKRMLVYDIAGRRWAWGPGPTPREHLGVTALNGRIYAIGGRKAGADTNVNLVESYVPGAKSWKRLPPVPGKRGGTGAAAIGRLIVSAGGETPTRTIGTVFALDVKRRRWLKLPPLRAARHGLGVVAAGRKVYVIGGGTKPGLSVSATNEFFSAPRSVTLP